MIEAESKGFDKYIEGQLGKYKFQVGVFDTKQSRYVKRPVEYGQYAGTQIRKPGTKKGKVTNVDKALELDEKYKWLRKPWTIAKNKDLFNVIKMLVENLNGKANDRRFLNSIQAVVRNPILRSDYGKNERKTAKAKGFNKLMIDTAQFFKSIKARWYK